MTEPIYCDNCGQIAKVKKVKLPDESGLAWYCINCVENNRREVVEDENDNEAIRKMTEAADEIIKDF